MNDIVPFSFDDQPVRISDRDGEPWFILADVCRVLDIRNVADAAARLDDDERDVLALSDSIGRTQDHTAINESGLYRLILRSRKDQAKRFSKWVTRDVLPSIRRTGGYGNPRPGGIDLDDNTTLRALLLGKIDRLDALQPKADALDRLANVAGLLCITDAAKALGVRPRRLFAWLEAHAWIYRRGEGGHWVAFETKLEAKMLEHKGETIRLRSRPDKWVERVMVTAKGLARLAELGAGA